MKKRINWMILFVMMGVLISGCSPRAKYNRMLKRELASGVKCDSLFMGLYFGMPEKDFYLHCWALNKKGLIRQGENNTTVHYEMKKELKYPASMDFYPKFKEGKISEMPVMFKYTGWAPWNKELTSKKLQADIVRYFEKTYGERFFEVKDPKRGSAFISIKGNRRISVFIQNDLYTWALFTNMLTEKNWNGSPTSDIVNPGDTTKAHN
jgi:hypothetical protein